MYCAECGCYMPDAENIICADCYFGLKALAGVSIASCLGEEYYPGNLLDSEAHPSFDDNDEIPF